MRPSSSRTHNPLTKAIDSKGKRMSHFLTGERTWIDKAAGRFESDSKC